MAILTLVSIAFMFLGIIGLSSEGSGPMFALPVLVLSALFTILFGVMWAKVAEERKQAKLAFPKSSHTPPDSRT